MKYLQNVVTLEFFSEKCKNCGMCLLVCPQDVFKQGTEHVEIKDRDKCLECGACMKNCPYGAISVETGVGCAEAFINRFIPGKDSQCGCCTE